MHSILPTSLRDTAFIDNKPARLRSLLCFILFFALSVVNLVAWTSSTREMNCEQFQAPCIGLFNNYNQVDDSLSDVSIPECFQCWLADTKDSFPVQVYEDLPLSGSNTCKCSRGSGGQTLTFRARLADSLQRPICLTSITPFQDLSSELVVLWRKSISIRPPDHLKPLSTIVLII